MVHLGIIPDGNRRYAREHGISKHEAYEKGFELVRDTILHVWFKTSCEDSLIQIEKNNTALSGISEVTIYVCSYENITKRDDEDKKNILDTIQNFIFFFFDNIKKFKEKKLNINIAGDISILPFDFKEKLLSICSEAYFPGSGYTLNLAICYDPKQEVVRAYSRESRRDTPLDVPTENPLTIDNFCDNLYVKTQMDVVIRTGYEKRTSGFFPLQTLYAEWFFIDKHWPDMTVELLRDALELYKKRGRRFGA